MNFDKEEQHYENAQIYSVQLAENIKKFKEFDNLKQKVDQMNKLLNALNLWHSDAEVQISHHLVDKKAIDYRLEGIKRDV